MSDKIASPSKPFRACTASKLQSIVKIYKVGDGRLLICYAALIGTYFSIGAAFRVKKIHAELIDCGHESRNDDKPGSIYKY